MKLTLGFSSCPNDTFMFDALVHKKIDTEELDFEIVMQDIEKLNVMAFQNQLDITKLSYHAFIDCIEDYALLDSGSAFGINSGPILISCPQTQIDERSKIGIPGKYTTANMLLNFFASHLKNKQELLFSEIENAILKKELDAGVIIHENRFTYKKKGLKKILDLGEAWKKETGLPIPLGGIFMKRDLSQETQLKVERVLRRSVDFALQNPNSSKKYVKSHAQETEGEVIKQHINLYVNELSISLNEQAKQAIREIFHKSGKISEDIFVAK